MRRASPPASARLPERAVPLALIALVAVAAAALGSAATIAVLTPGDRTRSDALMTAPVTNGTGAEAEIAAGPLVAVEERPGAAPSDPLAAAERAQLAQSVLALSRRGDALEARIAELVRALEAQRVEETNASAEGALPSGEATDGLVAGDEAGQGGGGGDGAPRDGLAAFVAAGLDSQRAAELAGRRDEHELARLELIDRATREGWRDSARFDEALDALEARRPDLRAELGDDTYDRYLYEEGASNRVGIGSIIGGSAAALAGLEAGDVVLSYADERVFRTRDLQTATRGGQRGEYVQLIVSRDGEPLVVDVPRGPLGVTLRPLRRAPL